MNTNAFAALASLQLPSTCRLLPSACCPDKDLVVLISRLGGRDRMSLWKMQGPKKWEVDVGTDSSSTEEIVGLAWSPNGQSIAVAHDPPRISLHSVHDGREERFLPIPNPGTQHRRAIRITGVWWFQQEKTRPPGTIPDIFKRNGVVTGTAHSVLKILPLLDHLQEDTHKVTATDLFAFQGSQIRSAPKSVLPEAIKSWPTLLLDPISASISVSHQAVQQRNADDSADDDDSNVDSILVVADDFGRMHYFLDGSYPLGPVSLDNNLSTPSLFKDPESPLFFLHPQRTNSDVTETALRPLTINLHLLEHRMARDAAKLSTTARSLLWYTMRVVKEMRSVWFGSDTYSGARELGPKWVRALETKQQEQFGQEEPNSILDLTCLLLTGRASDSLQDFLGSGEHMSERGIQKWETTMTEALVRLRDYADKRVVPACQRLHLVLEEILGCSLLPTYAAFKLSKKEITDCLDLTTRAIIIASWLTAVVRRELSRFKEFILWLRFEINSANPTGEGPPSPRHDILEVNNYFMSGLVVSSIDKWFLGSVPQFTPQDLGVPSDGLDLAAVLERARTVVNDPAQMAWQSNVKQKDLSHLDRNLDVLIQELAIRCQRVFSKASGAVARSAIMSRGPGYTATQVAGARQDSDSRGLSTIRERIIRDENQAGQLLQYLAIHVQSGDRTLLCMARMPYGCQTSASQGVGIAMLECKVPVEGSEEEGGSGDFDMMAVEFFDDESLVIVYRTREEAGPAFMATVSYNDLGYGEVPPEIYVNVSTREELMLRATERWKEGHLASEGIPIRRCRQLGTCREGEVSLAVNGRAGRRVACVLDGNGTAMEILDLEGDGEDEGSSGEEERGPEEGET